MKLIIEIPEREYKVICENNYVAVCACPNLLSNAIKNGTPLDNATNGDVIKAMFPNTELHKESDYVSLTIQDGVYLEDRDGSWWNAPYQKVNAPTADVLEQLRDEIEHLTITEGGEDYVRKMAELYSLKIKVLQIIDKYR